MAVNWNRIITVSDEETVNILCGKEVLYLSTGGGKDGRGIISITKTGTEGSVDTYTILYTDYTTSTFTVTNGTGAWGQIGGTLSNQADLWTVLSGKTNLTMVAESFSTATSYTAGDCVIYNGSLYRFVNDHIGGWSSSDAEQIKIMDGGSGGTITEAMKIGTVNNDETFEVTYQDGQTGKITVKNNAGIYVPSEHSADSDEPAQVLSMRVDVEESEFPDTFRLTVEPYQTGTGTPSSENVRPFAEIGNIHLLHSCDLNLITRVQYSASPFLQNGIMPSVAGKYICLLTSMSTGEITTPDIPGSFWCDLSLPAGIYYLSGAEQDEFSTTYGNIRIYDEDSETDLAVHTPSDNGPVQFALLAAKPNLKLYVDLYDLEKVEGISRMLEIRPMLKRTVFKGAYMWEQFGGDFVITVPNPAGGVIDLVNGTITADKGYIAEYNGEELPGQWWSDRDEYAAGTSPTAGAEVIYELDEPVTTELTIYGSLDADDLLARYHKFDAWTVSGDPEPTMHYITAKADYPVFTEMATASRKFVPWQEYFDQLIAGWDAPQDGNVYGRKNGAWAEAGGGGTPSGTAYYYVDVTNGDDTNDGSQASPWKTITKAVSETQSSQRTYIYIAAGTYSEGEFPDNRIEISNKKDLYLFLQGTVILNDHVQIYAGSNVHINSAGSSGADLKIYGSMEVSERSFCYGDHFANIWVYATQSSVAVKVNDSFMQMDRLRMYADASTGSALEAYNLSHVFIDTAYAEAKDGLCAYSGSLIAYDELTGTMTNQTLIYEGGQIFTGSVAALGTMASQNDAPSDSQEYVRKNGAWAVSSASAPGATQRYYVDVNGSDSNPGTYERRFRTIDKALTMCNAVSDTTISVFAGEYELSNRSIENKKFRIALNGNVTISNLASIYGCDVSFESTNNYTLKIGILQFTRCSSVYVNVPIAPITSPSSNPLILTFTNCPNVYFGNTVTLDTDYLSSQYYALKVLEKSNVYIKTLDITAVNGVQVKEGSVLAYETMTGTMTTPITTESGGRVYTGAQ